MKKTFLFILIAVISLQAQAQVNDNPINELSLRLFQNEMLTHRFLKNFVFIQTNTFKKKTLVDMDKSLARFDDNLNYIVLHVPEKKEIQDDFMGLQEFWNVYRLFITDYENKNYKALVEKSKKFEKLTHKLTMNLLQEHPDYSANKKSINLALYDVENIKMLDKIATAYIMKGGLHVAKAYTYFNNDFDMIKKYLKKIAKYKKIAKFVAEDIEDLYTTLHSIETLYYDENYSPKIMYSQANAFTKKSYKILNIITNNIK